MNKRGAYQKKDQNLANLRARHDLLVRCIDRTARISKEIEVAIADQRSFAAMSLPKQGIFPIALNTLKSLASELYPEPDFSGKKGFAFLDALRIQVKGLVESKAKAPYTAESKTNRSQELINNLTARLQVAELQNIYRSKAYLDLFSKINALIKEGALPEATRLRLFNLLDGHHAAFGGLFAPELPSGEGGSSVVPLHPIKDR